MPKYFLKLLLFSLPLITLFALPLWVFYIARENMDFGQMLRLSQEEPDSLVGLAYTNLDRPFKMQLALESNAQVLALGTSRVGQFRASFFQPDVSFYNAESAVQYAPDFESFLNSLPDNSPTKYLIVALDPHFFNGSDESLWRNRSEHYQISLIDRLRSFLSTGWKTFYRDYSDDKFTLQDLLVYRRQYPHRVGLNALINSAGFRQDGSSAPHKATDEAERVRVLRTDIAGRASGIAPGGSSYEYGPRLSPFGLRAIERFLAAARKRGIKVIGFLPPHATIISDRIRALDNQNSESLEKLPETLETLFRKYSHTFYNLSDPRTFGSSDLELIDAIHGSEKMYSKLTKYLAEHDPRMREIILVGKLPA